MANILKQSMPVGIQTKILGEIADFPFRHSDYGFIDIPDLISGPRRLRSVQEGSQWFLDTISPRRKVNQQSRLRGMLGIMGRFVDETEYLHTDDFVFPLYTCALAGNQGMPAGTVAITGLGPTFDEQPIDKILRYENSVPLFRPEIATAPHASILYAQDGEIMRLTGANRHARPPQPDETRRLVFITGD